MADRRRALLHDVPRGPERQHQRQQQEGQADVEVAQPLDARFQADVNAHGKGCRDGCDHHQVQPKARVQTGYAGQTGADHGYGQPHAGADRTQQADHEKQVNNPAQPTVSAAAENGLAGGTEPQHRHLAHMVGVGDGDAGQAVKRPADEAPVEDGVAGRPAHRLVGAGGDAEGWRVVVVGPLHGSPIEHAGADAAAEQHGGPTEVAVVRG